MLIEDPELRDRMTTVIREVVAEVDRQTESEIDILGDRALLRAYVEDLVPDEDGVAMSSLTGAIEAFGAGKGTAGLYGGAARVGWLVAHVAGGDVADEVCAAIDTALLRRIDGDAEPNYDLISGLVGFGIYALERGEAGHKLATRVLDVLEQRAVSRGPGIAWFTEPELLPPWQRENAQKGYWNFGLAHGVPGIIGLLARYIVHGIEVERSTRLVDQATAWLLAAVPPDPGGRFPAWEAEGTPLVRENTPRLAWCYGDLGLSIALLAAARARDNAAWRDEALAMALSCAARPHEQAAINDGGLCHGAAGSAHLFHRLYHATKDERFADAARSWATRTLAMRFDHPIAGFPSRSLGTSGLWEWAADGSLLTGAPGVALALHAMITDVEPNWDRLLMVDL